MAISVGALFINTIPSPFVPDPLDMSIDLQWELVRKNNAFVVKRSGYTFSTEPANLTNKHSYKYSGFAQNKVRPIAPLRGPTLIYDDPA